MKKTILILIILCSIIHLNGQEKTDSIQIPSYIKKDFLICDTVNWNTYPKLHDIESNDKKIRLLTFNAGNDSTCRYIHELRYKTTPTTIQSSSLQDFRFFDLQQFQSLRIDTIYHVTKDIYILEGMNEENEYFMMGIDIERGIARNAYIFPQEEKEEETPICLISFPVDTTKYIAKKIKAELEGNKIRLPETKENQFTGKYINYYFNGAHYEDSLSYSTTYSHTRQGEEIITRINFKDGNNRWILKKLYASQPYSVEMMIASENEIIKPVSLTLQNEDKTEHWKGKLFEINMTLKPINGTVFVENLDSYRFPIIKSRKWLKPKLKTVKYTAGRKEAFPFERLRYTAAIFNRPIKEEECQLVRWALEIDGNLQLLDGKEWQGTQIDLQIRKEWLGKTILVIPYIEGRSINKKVAIKTTIEPYLMMIYLPEKTSRFQDLK